MVVRGNMGWSGAGPTALAGSGSVSYDGSTTSTAAVGAISNPQNYSIGIWFKTSVPQGALVGFTSSAAGNTSNDYRDRILAITTTGNLDFATVPAGTTQLAGSTTNVADGAWHYAVATAAASSGTTSTTDPTTGTVTTSPTSTITLYVDGSLAASTTINNANSSTPFSGYWHTGATAIAANSGGLVSSDFFSGSLSNFTYFPKTLTSTDVTNLYSSTSQSAYSAAAATAGATQLWKLNSTGTDTYSGSLPGGAPCAHVSVTAQAGATCAYPLDTANPCPALSTSYTLATLISSGGANFAAVPTGSTQSLVLTLAENANISSGFDTGLHLVLPTTLTEKGFTQNLIWSNGETIL
jgi:hypothetical protein